jgi:hypothetical protein
MIMKNDKSTFVLCVDNEGYEVSLEKRKVYRRLNDEKAGDDRFTRVIDESGEDYLFPSEFFVPIIIPEAASAAFEEATA